MNWEEGVKTKEFNTNKKDLETQSALKKTASLL